MHAIEDDKEYEQQAAQERQWAAERSAVNSKWKAKWPNHCSACGGWGGATSHQSVPYGATTAAMPIFDICDALPETQCHRCGQHGLTQESDGPCSFCGWNFDDGLE